MEKATISWEADSEVDGNSGYEMNVLITCHSCFCVAFVNKY